MNPLSSIYGAAVAGRNALYDRRFLAQRRLEGPVISIGNLSVGGTGKTPFTILLGQMLLARGLQVDVLSRGYGRKTRGVVRVEPGGSARDFGDEPLLIARRLGIPVVLGEDRFAAGEFAEKTYGPAFHLLDDGFQHRALARDFDIVLVTPDDARDRLLPSGRLREPLASLRRADAIVLTSGASPEAFPVEGPMVWRARRGIAAPAIPAGPVAFCGIARPKSFFLQLRAAGIEPAAEAVFRDHHAYTEADIRDLLELRRQSEGQGFVTTEKDAINLGGYLSALQPLAVVPVTMDLVASTNALDSMLRMIDDRRRSA